MPHDFKTACEEPLERFAEGPEGVQGSDPAANSDFDTLWESGSIKISNINGIRDEGERHQLQS